VWVETGCVVEKNRSVTLIASVIIKIFLFDSLDSLLQINLSQKGNQILLSPNIVIISSH
jgi:hypothetical protein